MEKGGIIPMNKGRFISFEGGEGVGKTTLISRLEAILKEAGAGVMVTREPGGIAIAEQIRAVLLNKDHTSMDARTEALLYAAARRQHLIEKVIPALQAGAIVLTDRYVDSSLAYQGYARGLGIDEVWRLNQFAVDGWMPDLTILMDLDPEQGQLRIRSDAEREVNRLDLESLAFHRRVREGYRQAAARFPERIVTLDASRSMEQVFRETARTLRKLLPELAKIAD